MWYHSYVVKFLHMSAGVSVSFLLPYILGEKMYFVNTKLSDQIWKNTGKTLPMRKAKEVKINRESDRKR